MATSRKTQEKVERPKRIPIHRSRDILTINKKPEGKVLRWVMDSPGRLIMFQEAGYEFVTDAGVTVGDKQVDGNKATGSTVCRAGDKEGTMLYLMAIDEDLYNEDQKARQAEIDENERAMFAALEDGQYDAGIKYDPNRTYTDS